MVLDEQGFASLPAEQGLHSTAGMRRSTKYLIAAALVACAGGSQVVHADERPLATVEARAGHGLALGGGSGEFRLRSSPLTFSVVGEIAVREQPWTTIVFGGVYEGGDRAAAGGLAAVRLRPERLLLRATVGVWAIVTPVIAIGPSIAIGRCRPGAVRVCLDVEATVFVIGDDLPDRSIAAQLQLVIGVGFDLH